MRKILKLRFLFLVLVMLLNFEYLNAKSNSGSKKDLKSTNMVSKKDERDISEYIFYLFEKIQDISMLEDPIDPLSQVIKLNLAFDDIVNFVLGRYGQDFNASELKKFDNLYEKFLIKNYAEKIILATDGKLKIVNISKNPGYVNETYNVLLNFTDKDGMPIKLEVILVSKNNKYLIYDIVVENISIIINHRIEFNEIIESQGVEYLLNKLDQIVSK